MRKIRLQTIQPYAFWLALKENGVISGDHTIIRRQICSEFQDEQEQSSEYGGFLNGYRWIEQVMRERDLRDFKQCSAPIFAWCQFRNKTFKIADLRHCKTYIPKGETGVRITFDLPLNRVFNTPAIDNLTDEEWENLTQEQITNSWQNIIYSNTDYLSGRYPDKSIQATCFNILLRDVVKVDFFKRK